jgi:hypothetical protein
MRETMNHHREVMSASGNQSERQACAPSIEVMDRIRFTTADGPPRSGYVAAVRMRSGSDAARIWVELEHDPAGRFCAIAAHDVISSDNGGAARRLQVDEALWRRLALCDFDGLAQ